LELNFRRLPRGCQDDESHQWGEKFLCNRWGRRLWIPIVMNRLRF
jgi:hypothetical protein